MGLGKTVKSLVYSLFSNVIMVSTVLSRVAPLSTIPNRLQEIEVWTDFRVSPLFSNEPRRKVMKKHMFFNK
jgi:hypothetical protein